MRCRESETEANHYQRKRQGSVFFLLFTRSFVRSLGRSNVCTIVVECRLLRPSERDCSSHCVRRATHSESECDAHIICFYCFSFNRSIFDKALATMISRFVVLAHSHAPSAHADNRISIGPPSTLSPNVEHTELAPFPLAQQLG